jgi:hypothetical protein
MARHSISRGHGVFVDAFLMAVSGKIRKAERREDSRKRFEEGVS